MYIVDKSNNVLIKAESRTFKSLQFKERQHLQEWIADNPSVLGEELLIIQKEFDGFSDTNERLDLLALDKQGNLVIIENKLDDSGKDVTWQAIKYASYCASLSTKQIIEIFDKYLSNGEKAEDEIKSFLDIEDIDEINLNQENTQRIIFVAAKFRKEITSSVMWLRNFGIDVKCVKVTACSHKDEIIVDFDQIIPVAEAEDYTIKMAEKKKEEKQITQKVQKTNDKRKIFWDKYLERKDVGKYTLYDKYDCLSWKEKLSLPTSYLNNVISNKTGSRVELYFHGSKTTNKKNYDFFESHKEELEKKLGELKWERLDEGIDSRISLHTPLCYLREEDQNELIEFFYSKTNLLIDAVKEIIEKYKYK